MGMSASQMRYIMITGKKSDIEYQGQQINQQRTSLATQSSSLNSNLLTLSVPTPPSTEDYTKVSYTYAANGTTYSVDNVRYMTSSYTQDGKTYDAGTYILTYTYSTTGPQAELYSALTNIRKDGSKYFVRVGSDFQTELTAVPTTAPTDDAKKAEWEVDQNNISYLKKLDTLSSVTQFYKYTGTNGKTVYIAASALTDATYDSNSQARVAAYNVNDQATISETAKEYGCKNAVYADGSGRLVSIDVPDKSSTGKYNTVTFTVNTTTDEDAYNDAFNEYTYQKQLYENKMNEINAQLEIIQAEDKKLELKLNDLDTQQQAITTEIDAIKKVIDKNIESSFKTFA